jgi:hypothetical protein
MCEDPLLTGTYAHITRLESCTSREFNKGYSSAGFSNADSIIRVKMNSNNYLSRAENSIIRSLLNTL